MEKEPCFCIEGLNLYLEQILVEFEMKPIFYLCKDLKEDWYVVLCANFEEERYIVVKSSMNSISEMLHGKIAMRKLIMIEKFFWEILASENISDDEVTKKDITQLPLQDLPYEDACFQIASKEIEDFTRKFDSMIWEQGTWDVVNYDMKIYIEDHHYLRTDMLLDGLHLRIQKYVQLFEKAAPILQANYSYSYEIESAAETELCYAA